MGARRRLEAARISAKPGLGKDSSQLRLWLGPRLVGGAIALATSGFPAGKALASQDTTPPPSLSSQRLFNLFPEDDLVVAPAPTAPGPKTRGAVTLGRTTLALGNTPCAALFSHIPLAYLTLQAGGGCTLQTGRRNTMAFEALLEGAYRKASRTTSAGGVTKKTEKETVRPGALLLVRHAFDLHAPQERRLRTTASLSFKWVPRESAANQEAYSKPKFNPFYTQRWADVLESRFTFGVLLSTPKNGTPDGYAAHIQYLETLPLALRRGGGLADSASLQYKQIALEGRARVGHFSFGDVFLGGGFGYAVLTFDGLRTGLPLPTLAAGVLW